MYDLHAALARSKFFEGISDESRQALAGICRVREYRKRDVVFHEHDDGEALFVLLDGDVQIHKLTPEGKEVVIKVIRPGEMFGEVVLFEKPVYPVTATAASPSTVLVIPKEGVMQLLEQVGFRNDFIAALMRKQRYLSERIHFLSYDVEERLRLFLLDHFGEGDQIQCRLSKKDVAAAIGTTPESLSRALLRLKERGLLQWQEDAISAAPGFWKKRGAAE